MLYPYEDSSIGIWECEAWMVKNTVQLFWLNVFPFPLSHSKMNRRSVWQKAMGIKQDLPNYNASIYLRTECSDVKRDTARTRKKNLHFQIWFNPHRYFRRRLRCANIMTQGWSHRNLIAIPDPPFFSFPTTFNVYLL